jgi:hypothetical protein
MPANIPTSILLYKALDKLASGIRMFLRGLLVSTIWLILLPYFTVWIWRLYFWIGESFAYRANGLETRPWNTSSFITSRNKLFTSADLDGEASNDTLLSNNITDKNTTLILKSLGAANYQWLK